MATIWNGNGVTNTTQGSRVPVVADIYRYVNEVGDDGWVNGRLNASTLLPLCKYTKVMLLDTKNVRTSFKVLDGSHAGEILSMSAENAKKYLGTKAPADSMVGVEVIYGKYERDWISVARDDQKLDQQWAKLSVDGSNASATMNTVWGPPNNFTPIPPGEYMILVPDTPHQGNMTTFYRNSEPSLKYDQVWFPIEYGNNSRYVHVGNVSEGCTTVVDLAKWADVHEKLISHRSVDKKYVGKLVVKGKPERAK